QVKTVTLTATFSDTPKAVDPVTSALVTTVSDVSGSGSVQIAVGAVTRTWHSWKTDSTIARSTIWTSSATPAKGEIVALASSVSRDADFCLNSIRTSPPPVNCFGDGTAENTVRRVGWNASRSGGSFGYLDMNGQFVSSADG